jgi:hypothetical protein
MSYEQGSYRVLLFLHNRITDNPYDQYSNQYQTAPSAFRAGNSAGLFPAQDCSSKVVVQRPPAADLKD